MWRRRALPAWLLLMILMKGFYDAHCVCIPWAFGHINPTLALVTELVKQGVRVTYFTTEAFRNIIEPTGAKFVAVPSWMAENDKHNDGEKKRTTAVWQLRCLSSF